MFTSQKYAGMKRDEIEQQVKNVGFDPVLISNKAGFVYNKHRHPETKLLVFLEGSMDVMVDDKHYTCRPGDEIIIPGNIFHSATVGAEGCEFFWSEKNSS